MGETEKVSSFQKNVRSKNKQEKRKVKTYAKKKKFHEPEHVFIEKLQEKCRNIDISSIKSFSDLPLSPKTSKGLKRAGYTKPTDIQRETIFLALQGKDILGASHTGSGKTLAFLIPILETLFCKQWSKLDGLGALVITPTRELAYQIFETLRMIGSYHDFSAGLIIGGKDLKFERKRMDQCNIIICTPGRLLHHMDENPLFDCYNVQILVLDEADRCLDMGFKPSMTAIIANLPAIRQTLLFSATQTKSVKDLALLSLRDPQYVSVHEHSDHSTPNGLQQSYVVCQLENKISILWSFIKNHLKQKCIIFLSTCKEVKYVYEIFCRLRPGTTLLALYGRLHQLRRMKIYETFRNKTSAVLFATDLASRGLDFPAVHWVVQGDCPEDVPTYIHRVGRTARYQRGGESLLLLLESEQRMVDDLKERKIPIEKIDINPLKLNNPLRKMEAFLARDSNLKATAQRAFVAYAKSVFLSKNKEIFNINLLNTDEFAKSLGLTVAPRIRFIERMKKKEELKRSAEAETVKPNPNKKYFPDNDDENLENGDIELEFKDSDIEDDEINVFNKKLEIVKSTGDLKHELSESEGEDEKKASVNGFQIMADEIVEESVFDVKEEDRDVKLPSDNQLVVSKPKKALTRAAIVKKMLKSNTVQNTKIIFDDDDETVAQAQEKKSELSKAHEMENICGVDIEKLKETCKEEDRHDKEVFRELVKAKHKAAKKKLKEKKSKEQEEKDDFSSESEEEPDLSWVPDPDKIYGSKSEDNGSEEDVHNESKTKILEQPEKHKTKKRKLKKEKLNDAKKRKIENAVPSMSVTDAEELALMLLKDK